MLKVVKDYLKLAMDDFIREELSGTYGVNTVEYTPEFGVKSYGIDIRYECGLDRYKELDSKSLIKLSEISEKGILPKYTEAVGSYIDDCMNGYKKITPRDIDVEITVECVNDFLKKFLKQSNKLNINFLPEGLNSNVSKIIKTSK